MVIPTTDALNQSTVMRQIRKLAEIVKTNFEEVLSRFSSKQDKLEAGDGIVINGNVISAPGGGGTGVTIDDELSTSSTNPVQNKVITEALNGKQPTGNYQPAGDYATSSELATGLAGKQNVLTAGTGISIVNDVISAENVSGDFVEKGFVKCRYSTGQMSDTVSNIQYMGDIIRDTIGTGHRALVILTWIQARPITGDDGWEIMGIFNGYETVNILGWDYSGNYAHAYNIIGGCIKGGDSVYNNKIATINNSTDALTVFSVPTGFNVYALDLGTSQS